MLALIWAQISNPRIMILSVSVEKIKGLAQNPLRNWLVNRLFKPLLGPNCHFLEVVCPRRTEVRRRQEIVQRLIDIFCHGAALVSNRLLCLFETEALVSNGAAAPEQIY